MQMQKQRQKQAGRKCEVGKMRLHGVGAALERFRCSAVRCGAFACGRVVSWGSAQTECSNFAAILVHRSHLAPAPNVNMDNDPSTLLASELPSAVCRGSRSALSPGARACSSPCGERRRLAILQTRCDPQVLTCGRQLYPLLPHSCLSKLSP